MNMVWMSPLIIIKMTDKCWSHYNAKIAEQFILGVKKSYVRALGGK